MPLIVALASDHSGVELKTLLVEHLNSKQIAHVDLGPYSANAAVDYPDYARKLCEFLRPPDADVPPGSELSMTWLKIMQESVDYRGILICGTGIGMAMVANRHSWIRCAVAERKSIAEITRMHNDTNVIALGARVIRHDDAAGIVDAFLNTRFEAGRHRERLMKFGMKP